MYDLYAMGNALVDEEYEVNDEFLTKLGISKGHMTLIDYDQRTQILASLKDEGIPAHEKKSGGSAANSAIAASQFGLNTYYAARVSSDELGPFYLKDLADNGVDCRNRSALPEGQTGQCLVLITKDAQRSMNTYLGITSEFSNADMDYEKLKQSKWLYIEGYLVAQEGGYEAMVDAIKFAKEHHVKVALTLSDVSMVRFFRERMLSLLADGQVDLLFSNEEEAMELTGESNFIQVREEIKKYAKQVVITLGANGATLWDGHTYIDVESYQTQAIDTNGAGDMFAGAYMYGLISGLGLATSASLASLASSKIVSQFGPRLKLSDVKLLMNEFKGINQS